MDMGLLNFTEDEIRKELFQMGYRDVSPRRLNLFKRELDCLVSRSSDQESAYCGSSEGAVSFSEPSYTPRRQDRLETLPFSEDTETSRLITYSNTRCDRNARGDGKHMSSDIRDLTGELEIEESQCDWPSVCPKSGSKSPIVARKIARAKAEKDKPKKASRSDPDIVPSAMLDKMRLLDLLEYHAQPRKAFASSDDILSVKSAKSTGSSQSSQPPKSFIRTSENPHTRNLQKHDPVARYHQFNTMWSKLKTPGENAHSDLRWNIREQMLTKEEVKRRPASISSKNDYVIPTMKKRGDLRWKIRHALANYEMP